MEQYMVWVWLGVTVAAIIAEVASVQLVSIWFAMAGAVSIAFSFIPGFPWWGQVILFAVLAAGSLLGLRPFCKKWLDRRGKNGKTNMDLIIGKEVRMIATADFDHLGQAKVGDVVWSIKPLKEEVLEEGSIVKIVAVEGNKLIATKSEDAESSDNE
jgi:membrane protein implicated in regulation of membrane protease activity